MGRSAEDCDGKKRLRRSGTECDGVRMGSAGVGRSADEYDEEGRSQETKWECDGMGRSLEERRGAPMSAIEWGGVERSAHERDRARSPEEQGGVPNSGVGGESTGVPRVALQRGEVG